MKTNHISIKNLSEDDRPREKLLLNGRSTLSNAEILAILIGSGSREKSAVQLCQKILQDVDNDINILAKKSIKDLMKYKGIGEAKAISIIAALELGRRKKDTVSKKVKINSSRDAYTYIKHLFEDLNHEEFYIIILNRANVIKGHHLISKGGLSNTVADGKLIFKIAIEQIASAIILCHNHPSGNLTPSKSDIELTKNLKQFGNYVDLPIFDHLIVTDDDYFSFADNGLIK
ncbi:MAG TPA: DNA repair protein RadC [Crocinitomix sp.]|nr:DNA repair protein RadC [Crocinitomix sp.]